MLNLEIRHRADRSLSAVSIAALTLEVRGTLRIPDKAPCAAEQGGRVSDAGPALIVDCADAHDVMRCLTFATERDLLIAMRNGGDNLSRWQDCDHGIALDLSHLAPRSA